MSGHSKWHKVRQYKGAIDAKRASTFTKMARNITVAARLGGGDPAMNFRLRMAIDRAKAASVPKDVIERAIKRGTGELDGGEIVEAVYEGFGPGKVGMIVVAQTDNTNRAVTDIKTIFSKNGGELAQQGAVMWNFDKKGVVYIQQEQLPATRSADELELALIDAGATDMQRDDDTTVVFCEVADYGSLMKKIEELGIEPKDSGLEYVAKTTKQLNDEDESKLAHIIELLEDNDDVESVFHEAA